MTQCWQNQTRSQREVKLESKKEKNSEVKLGELGMARTIYITYKSKS